MADFDLRQVRTQTEVADTVSTGFRGGFFAVQRVERLLLEELSLSELLVEVRAFQDLLDL